MVEVYIMTCEEAQGLIQVLKKIMGTDAFSIPKQGSKAALTLSQFFPTVISSRWISTGAA